MRSLLKKNDQWVEEKPEDLSKWMWRHDGEDAVVVDDATKTYYCGKVSVCEEYRKNGKKSAMFADLDRQLFVQEQVKVSAFHQSLFPSGV